MEYKETLTSREPHQTIIEDTEFYKYIFKKTEKICCAVFYILRSNTDIGQDDVVVQDLEDAATALLDVSLESLRASTTESDLYAREVQHSLISLEAKLRVAHASRILREGYLEVFQNEIDLVLRALRKYTERKDGNPLFTDEVRMPTFRTEGRAPVAKRTQTGGEARATLPVGQTPTLSRRDRILSIIKDKGEASIKDISTVVTDCSEKTIQRELIDMIKDGIILRDGERRWSKYKPA